MRGGPLGDRLLPVRDVSYAWIVRIVVSCHECGGGKPLETARCAVRGGWHRAEAAVLVGEGRGDGWRLWC